MKRPVCWALVLSLLLCSCGSRAPSSSATPEPSAPVTPEPSAAVTEPVKATIFAMDTVMSLQVYGTQEDLDAVTRDINTMEATLSVTRETSQVWAVNHSDGAPVSVSEEFCHLVRLAREVGDRTGGALDVTMYPVVKAWGFTTGAYRIPDEQELDALLEGVDYTALTLDGSTATLPQGMEMDLGAIAKGYAGERAADLLRSRGVTSALLNMGGNVQTVGAKPDGSDWRIGIRDPNQGESSYLGVLRISDQAVVTSGGYERYFESNGVRYWHIMDPHTGAPARSGLLSATVVGSSGGLCDALSTALFVLGTEGALDYWRTWGGFELILVDEDNGLWITGGLADRFTPQESAGYTLHIVEE